MLLKKKLLFSPRQRMRLSSFLFGRGHFIKKTFIILSILTISGYQLQQAIVNFTNAINGTPTITNMSQTSGSTAGGDAIIVTGTNFQATKDVKFTQVSAGGSHSLAIDAEGQLWGWGRNLYGQLGTNNTNNYSTSPINISAPAQHNGQTNVLYGKTFTQVSAGNTFSLAIDSSGQLWSWGNNYYGQLANNSFSGSSDAVSTPINLSTESSLSSLPNVLEGKTFTQISAGWGHALAVDSSGGLWAWGRNHMGQIGNNDSSGTNALTPVNLSGDSLLTGVNNELLGITFSKIAAGGSMSLAIDSSGELWSWGSNYYGQLGNNTSTGLSTANPTPINLSIDSMLNSATNELYEKTFSHIVAGDGHVLAVDSSGELWTWGRNNNGQLGNNASGVEINSTPINLSEEFLPDTSTSVLKDLTFTGIATGSSHSLAIDSSGNLWAWGNNGYGQLGDNSTTTSSTPINLSTPTTLNSQPNVLEGKSFIHMSAEVEADGHTLAIDSSGQLWAWGNNQFGQLGNTSTTNSSTPLEITPTKITDNITSIKFGDRFAPSLTVANDTQLIVETPQSSAGFVDVTYNYLSGEIVKPDAFEFTLPTPSIDGLSETSGPIEGGEEITISGNNFMADQATFSLVTVSAGGAHTLAIDSSGQLWAWGRNNLGQLGNRSTSDSNTPINISTYGDSILNPVFGKTFIHVSAGEYHSLAIDSSGQLWSWGNNSYGQLGNNSTISGANTVPINLSEQTLPNSTVSALAGLTFSQVSAGYNHSFAIDSIGQLWAWGRNSSGQLGDNSTSSSSTPINLSLQTLPNSTTSTLAGLLFSEISGGGGSTGSHSLAIDSSGQLWAWGRNSSGQLGDNSTTDSSTPINLSEQTLPNSTTSVLAGLTFSHVSAGHYFSLVVDQTGRLWSWGSNTYGQLGDNSTASSSTPINLSEQTLPNSTTSVLAGLTFSHVSAGDAHSLIIDSSGQLWSWGENNYGQLGINVATGLSANSTPINLSEQTLPNFTSSTLAGLSFTQVSAGGIMNGQTSHSIAIDTDGRIWAWGQNSYGQIGDAISINYSSPICLTDQIISSGSMNILSGVSFAQVSAGSDYSLAIDSSGQLWVWGYNTLGQLGINTTGLSTFSTPINLSREMNLYGSTNTLYGKTFSRISAGDDHALAIDSLGQLWAWGWNGGGQLGDNSTDNSPTPINLSEQTLPNTTTSVLAGLTFSQIAAGAGSLNLGYSLAIDSSGQLWSWGSNAAGALGDNSTINSSTPINLSEQTLPNSTTSVLAGLTFSHISVGYHHSLAIDSSGQLWSWGSNTYGQLGDNSTSSSSTPINLSEQTLPNSTTSALAGLTFRQVSAGYFYSLAIDSSGQLWTWGHNNSGQLGVNSTTDSPTPISLSQQTLPNSTTSVLAGLTFSNISGGGGSAGSHSFAIDSSGQLWAWGYNNNGQLGINSSSSSSTPRSVTSQANMNGDVNTLYNVNLSIASAGYEHSLMLDSSGKLYSVGKGNYGQLGNNGGSISSTPKYINALGYLPSISSIFFGTYEVTNFAVTANGSITMTVPPASAPGTVDVIITAYDGQVATLTDGYTYEDYFINVSLDASNLAIPITPTGSGASSTRKQTLSFTTNTPSGVSVSMQTGGASNNLSKGGGTANIPSTSGTMTSSIALTNNSWGFAIANGSTNVSNNFDATYTEETSVATSSAKYASTPTTNDPELLIKSTSTPNPDTPNTTDIYYGARVNMDVPSGTYRVEVIYTVVGNP